ncbi:MAG: DNA mismatch repair endonuclease MutL [Acidobacteria bacterium]|nr:MAG: DNA mismatch repair endonuclease MutL [Acidobacteriota bacterium]
MIRVLPDAIANKIAAGEVVERPASVVKELLENALDAGARSLRLDVVAGGCASIRVSDDGCGMSRDDAVLALERHATSKLTDAESLSAIATLGFRGEALPAIASVSHFTLETAEAGAREGTRVRVVAGKIKAVEPAGLPPGTAITVANLFANIPARKKFLKSETTELGHITTLVTNYALAYPEVRFHLETPHRVLLSAPPVASHAERLQQVLGEELVHASVEFREQAGEENRAIGIFGFASRPEIHKLNRNSIYIFVNRRLVRDRLLQHALSAAYYNLLPANVFPAALLFLDLPFGEVDVNVHPAKTEVRFHHPSFIHDAVRDAIRNAIAAARPVPSFLHERTARPSAGPAWVTARPVPMSQGVDPALGISIADLPAEFGLTEAPPTPHEQNLPLAPRPENFAARPAPLPAAALVPEVGLGCGLREAQAVSAAPDSDELFHLRPLGQIRDSFIVAEGPSGLWLIDQHVAHERVLFEQISAARLSGAIDSQRLLMPLVVELEPGRALAFAEVAAELTASGFEAEPFGRNTVAVKAAPAGVAGEQVERLLREILEVAAPHERGLTLEAVRTRIAATIACHAAIKINMRLELSKMEWLLAQLAQTQYPMTCPHGRPILLRYSLEEIQRAFKRLN